MKFTYSQLVMPVLFLDGEKVPDIWTNTVTKDTELKNIPALTLKQAFRLALTGTYAKDAEEVKKTDEDRLNDYHLAQSILNVDKGQSIDITAKQVTRIQTLSFKFFSVEIFGFVSDVLEGKLKGFAPVGEGASEGSGGNVVRMAGSEDNKGGTTNRGNRSTAGSNRKKNNK